MARKEAGAATAILATVALIAVLGAVVNLAGAVFAGAVWVPSLSELALYRVEKSEPALFYGILVAFTALAAYFCWDLWRSRGP